MSLTDPSEAADTGYLMAAHILPSVGGGPYSFKADKEPMLYDLNIHLSFPQLSPVLSHIFTIPLFSSFL